MSLHQNRHRIKFSLCIPHTLMHISVSTCTCSYACFGEHEQIYHALMINRLKKDELDPELYLNNMTRAHLNRGVIALEPRINHLSDFYELVKEERND